MRNDPSYIVKHSALRIDQIVDSNGNKIISDDECWFGVLERQIKNVYIQENVQRQRVVEDSHFTIADEISVKGRDAEDFLKNNNDLGYALEVEEKITNTQKNIIATYNYDRYKCYTKLSTIITDFRERTIAEMLKSPTASDIVDVYDNNLKELIQKVDENIECAKLTPFTKNPIYHVDDDEVTFNPNTTYFFNAFSENSILPPNQTSLFNISEFTLPTSHDATFKIKDDDPTLSSDSIGRDKANDKSQFAKITFSDGQEITKESVYYARARTVKDSNENIYIMLEIEGESGDIDPSGVGDDIFIFVGNQPPLGEKLTITNGNERLIENINKNDLQSAGVVLVNNEPQYIQMPQVV